MTEGESRRDGGGGGRGRERISRAHFAHALLHKPTEEPRRFGMQDIINFRPKDVGMLMSGVII